MLLSPHCGSEDEVGSSRRRKGELAAERPRKRRRRREHDEGWLRVETVPVRREHGVVDMPFTLPEPAMRHSDDADHALHEGTLHDGFVFRRYASF